jgi:hypothetical protein
MDSLNLGPDLDTCFLYRKFENFTTKKNINVLVKEIYLFKGLQKKHENS